MPVEGAGGALQEEGSFLPSDGVLPFFFLCLLPTTGLPLVLYAGIQWCTHSLGAQGWLQVSDHFIAALLI